MTLRVDAMRAETHLNDLQADIEAGSRQLEDIHAAAREIRDTLFSKQLSQASLMGSLVRQLAELRRTMRDQRVIMRQLRHDLRGSRNRR
jgi:hypothetical protein